MQIEWKISKTTPLFTVSSNGDVKATDNGRMIKLSDNGHGYKQVHIMRKRKRYTRYVHRLVAECFIDNPNGFSEVNHKDGNKSNNFANNLEWVSRSENLKHSYRTGLKPMTTPKQQEAARKNVIKAREKRKDGWIKWSKTPKARETWLKNISKADRWNKKNKE